MKCLLCSKSLLSCKMPFKFRNMCFEVYIMRWSFKSNPHNQLEISIYFIVNTFNLQVLACKLFHNQPKAIVFCFSPVSFISKQGSQSRFHPLFIGTKEWIHWVFWSFYFGNKINYVNCVKLTNIFPIIDLL